jgi:hypothetical protein
VAEGLLPQPTGEPWAMATPLGLLLGRASLLLLSAAGPWAIAAAMLVVLPQGADASSLLRLAWVGRTGLVPSLSVAVAAGVAGAVGGRLALRWSRRTGTPHAAERRGASVFSFSSTVGLRALSTAPKAAPVPEDPPYIISPTPGTKTFHPNGTVDDMFRKKHAFVGRPA